MSLIEHLEELRKRILISLAAITVGMVGCYIFKGWVLELLVDPLGDRELITLSPTESFMTVFKVAAYGGLIIASPVVIYQIWAFVRPGLRTKEQRVVLLATAVTSLLFLAGIVFAWLMVLPRGLDFLLNYEADFFNQQIQASRYFSFVALFLLGFGLVFELPAMLLTLTWTGVIDSKTLSRQRRYALIIGAILSAVITPGGDFFSMIAMFVPFVLLYEFSVLGAKLIDRSRRKKAEIRAAKEEAEE
jgi:sec-independent protein translocase protein TatC